MIATVGSGHPGSAGPNCVESGRCPTTTSASIIDLGCGTGLLTVTLAAPGRSVVGVDPSATMLDRARARPGSDGVRWINGDSAAVQSAGFA